MVAFSKFFEQWVSAYYKNAIIGKGGDFYTAVSASRFFGGAIANYILNRLEQGDLELGLNIIDIGGNDFGLLGDIYEFLNALGLGVVEKCEFILIEKNAQSINVVESMNLSKDSAESKPNFRAFKSLDSIAALTQNSIFIANELFDALSCEIFNDNKMLFISEDSSGKFVGKFMEADSRISHLANDFGIKIGEIPLSYFDFVKILETINPHNKKWHFIAFDYGSKEISNVFSTRIFVKHEVKTLISNDFSLIDGLENYFQKSDITYNVPFCILESAFKRIGASEILFKRQDLGLVENFGLLDLMQKFFHSSQNSLYLRESSKIKTLLSLSEKFKVAIYVNF